MIGSHLTLENQIDVLERAKHRTKKEIAKLVRQLDPLPDVPARVEPLGPRGFTIPRAPSWSEFVASMVPVRELEPGNRPRDWMDASAPDPDPVLESESEPMPESESMAMPFAEPEDDTQRYSVQFTASQEYVELLDRAKDLLSHTGADKSLEQVHLRALQALVAELEKRRFGVGAKPREKPSAESTKRAGVPRQRGSRHVPAAVRREVWQRDGARCAYVDASGQRCRDDLGSTRRGGRGCWSCTTSNRSRAAGRRRRRTSRSGARATTRSPPRRTSGGTSWRPGGTRELLLRSNLRRGRGQDRDSAPNRHPPHVRTCAPPP